MDMLKDFVEPDGSLAVGLNRRLAQVEEEIAAPAPVGSRWGMFAITTLRKPTSFIAGRPAPWPEPPTPRWWRVGPTVG